MTALADANMLMDEPVAREAPVRGTLVNDNDDAQNDDNANNADDDVDDVASGSGGESPQRSNFETISYFTKLAGEMKELEHKGFVVSDKSWWRFVRQCVSQTYKHTRTPAQVRI